MKLATRESFTQSWHEHIRRLPASLVLSALALALVVAIFLAVNFGAIALPTSVIARILLNGTGLFHFARQWDPSIEVIVLQARLPVVIGAGLVGAALSIAGVLFQGMLRT